MSAPIMKEVWEELDKAEAAWQARKPGPAGPGDAVAEQIHLASIRLARALLMVGVSINKR